MLPAFARLRVSITNNVSTESLAYDSCVGFGEQVKEATTVTRLNGDALRDVATKVFAERTTTLSEAGAEYELGEMTSAVRAFRRMMRSTLESLPESAFVAQSSSNGEDHWTAGQVIAHLANSQASMTGAVRSLLEMPAAPEGDRHDVDAVLPLRDEALAILAAMEPDFDAFVSAIPADADLNRTMSHPRFGEMSTNGWMLLMALHEGDHLRQIRGLGE
jgi:hypothetical protein